jgi:hypothetical protein
VNDIDLTIQGMRKTYARGSVGVIQQELFKQGLEHATLVEASSAYGKEMHDAALQQGNEERTNYFTGDFVDRAAKIAPADIVTLDRVICCYHNVEGLVGLSATRARRLYGVVYPGEVWLVRLVFTMENLWYRLRSFSPSKKSAGAPVPREL